MKGLEEALILESLALKRAARLNNIALDYILNGRSTAVIEHDNVVTDIEVAGQFRGWPQNVTECHLRRCSESGIPECTCLEKIGVGGSEVL